MDSFSQTQMLCRSWVLQTLRGKNSRSQDPTKVGPVCKNQNAVTGKPPSGNNLYTFKYFTKW